jgi:hypothetical protein
MIMMAFLSNKKSTITIMDSIKLSACMFQGAMRESGLEMC